MENIKTLPPMERPREKLRYQGAYTLSDPELLAILIGTGTSTMPVLQLCGQMLGHAGQDLKQLSQMEVAELCRFKGIGEAKAVTLLAAFELAKRLAKPSIQLTTMQQVPTLLRSYGVNGTEHSCRLLLLTASKHLLAVVTLSLLDEHRMPDIHILLQIAADAGAANMVVCHCLPFTDVPDTPVLHGFHLLLSGAARLMAIRLDDHLVILEKTFTSLLS